MDSVEDVEEVVDSVEDVVVVDVVVVHALGY